MCTTRILRPRDVNSFQNQTLHAPPLDHRRRRRNSDDKSRRQNKTPVAGMKASRDRSLVEKFPTRNLVMEKVTILKRGEELKVEVGTDIKPDVGADVRPDIKPDVGVDVRPNIKSDVGADVRPDVKDQRVGNFVNKRTVRFADEHDLVLCSTDRIGPEPETLSKQISVHTMKVVGSCIYAGPGSAVWSPPPYSVPVPMFCANKVATTDLRRILKLDD